MLKRKILIIEMDITDAQETWTVAIQRAQLETRRSIEKQVIVKRSSQDRLICIPEVEPHNFVIGVREEIREI